MVGDYLIPEGQIDVSLISPIHRTCRVLYTRRIIDVADKATTQQGDWEVLSLPPPEEWWFANVRRVRARAVRI